MRKTLVGVVSLTLVAVLLSGCGSLGRPDYGEEYVTQHLNSDYSISYHVDQHNTCPPGAPCSDDPYHEVLDLVYTHTLDGGHYYSVQRDTFDKKDTPIDSTHKEYLFIKSGDSGLYDTYDGTAKDGFKLTAKAAVDQAFVDGIIKPVMSEMTAYFWALPVSEYGELSGPPPGAELPLGRTCDLFQVTKVLDAMGTWCIDREAGVVLVGQSGGMLGMTKTTATAFKLGDVTLPPHE